MKKLFFEVGLFLLFWFGSFFGLFGQTTIVLQPDSVVGKDAWVLSAPQYSLNNQSNSPRFNICKWTYQGTPGEVKQYIDFDLTNIPNGAIVTSATLTLFGVTIMTTNPEAHSCASGTNECHIRRVTSSWNEHTLLWNNQPTSTTQNQILFGPLCTPNTDIIINMTQLINDALSNPNNSFGFLFQLQTPNHYRRLIFASSDYSDATKHPKLEITYDWSILDLGNDTTICNPNSLTLDATYPNATYLWSDNSTDSTLNVSQSGSYWVEMTVGSYVTRDTINITVLNPSSINLGVDTSICIGDSLLLNPNMSFTNYLWQDGSTNPTYTVYQSGMYFVDISNICGTGSDTINVNEITSNLVLNLGNDTILCFGEVLNFEVSNIDATDYLWQNGSTNSIFTISQDGQYYVEVSNSCVSVSDTIEVSYINLSVDLGDDLVAICENDLLRLEAFHPTALTYLWQNGSTESSFTVTESGVYQVEVTNACETVSDMVEVIVSEPTLLVNLGLDQNLCDNETTTLDATSAGGIWYIWEDSSTSPIRTIMEVGEYEVTVKNGCLEVTDDIVIRNEDCCNLYIPNGITPNNDGFNDEFQVYLPSNGCNTITTFSIEIYDRWGGKVFETTDINAKWNATTRGKTITDGIYVWIVRYNDGVKDYQISGDLTVVR